MGTRGLFGVRIGGVDKLTYNHYDSYPDGLGEAIVEDIKDLGVAKLRKLAKKLEVVDDKVPPTKDQKEKLAPYTDLGVSNQSTDDWYCLTRQQLQGKLKETLKVGLMIDSHNFIRDSLFCEWAWIVNLDEDVLEVYRGFQRKEHTKGRYAFLPSEQVGGEEITQYYPCALLATFPLEDIPTKWKKKLEKIRKDEDDESE